MASITPSANDLLVDNKIYTWSPLTFGDTGDAVGATGTGDRTVQILGTFGVGTSVAIEGTLNGTDWQTLRDPTGNLLTFSAPGLKAVLENVIQLRPHVIAGDGTEQITVLVAVRRTNNG